jgi:hypothetical protein
MRYILAFPCPWFRLLHNYYVINMHGDVSLNPNIRCVCAVGVVMG